MKTRVAYVTSDGKLAILMPNEGYRNASKVIMPDDTVVEAREFGKDFVAVERLYGPWLMREGTRITWAETETAFIERVSAKDIPADATTRLIVEPENLPATRTFPNAWTILDGKVVVDMSKARIIHMDKIRAARNEKLATLDGPWMRAFARGQREDATRIEAQREVLRNLPATVNLEQATTPEALAAIWPDVLM